MRDFGTNFGIATRLKRVGLPRTRSTKKVVVGEILLKQSFWKGIPAKNGNLAEKLIQN